MKLSANTIATINIPYNNYVKKIDCGFTPKVNFINKPIKNTGLFHKITSLFKPKNKTIDVLCDDSFKEKNIVISVENGKTLGINGTTYVNNNGKFEALNLTHEKFKDLFPANQTSATQGKYLGDCWLVSTINTLMQKTNGRIAIYRKFGQDWNDMYVKLPQTDVLFPDSKTIQKHEYQLSGSKGLQMLEEAIALTKSLSATNNFHHANEMTGFCTIMDGLNGGSQTQALLAINPEWNPKIINLDKTTKQISMIKKYANKDNMFLGIMTTKDKEEKTLLDTYNKSFDGKLIPVHAFGILGYDKKAKIVSLQDPLNPENLIKLTIAEIKKYPFTLTVCKL